MQTRIKLFIKNPAGNTSLTLEVSADATVAELHGLLADGYEGKPPASTQTLIFAGKVLKDPTVSIRKLVEKQEPFEGPHSFHLVVRKPQDPNQAAASSTPSSSTAPMPPTPTPVPLTAAPTAPASSSDPSGPSPPHASVSASTSTAAPAPEAQTLPQAHTPSASQADTAASAMYPYMYVNPIYAAAYQAAYAAALAASMQAGAMQSPGLQQFPMPNPYYMSNMYPSGYMPYEGVSAGQQAQQHMHGVQMSYLYAAGAGAGAPAAAPSLVAHIIQGGPNGPEIRIEGLPQDALGPVAIALNNLRQRRGVVAAPGGGAAPHNQVHVHMRPRRLRGITLRISARAMLQALVLAMVIYQQHYSVGRLVALSIGGLVVWLVSYWEPLRRLLANLQQPPGAPRPAPAADNAPAPAQQPEARAGPDAAAAPAGGVPAPVAQRPRAWIILHELLVLILGFLTSLLPTWNYNPDDAAAFAAAQAIAAREDQRQQQEGGVGGMGAADLGPADAAVDQGDGAAQVPPAQAAAAPVQPHANAAANVEPVAA